MRTDVRQALVLKGTVMSINKHTNKIDAKYDVTCSQITAIEDTIDYKMSKIENVQSLQNKEQQAFFDISQKRNENYMKLSDDFAHYRHELNS